MHLAAEAELRYFSGGDDAGARLAQRRVTSSALRPIEETMPMPVTATRRICSLRIQSVGVNRPDPQVTRLIDRFAVGLHHPVGDAHHQFADDHPLQVDP